MSAVEASSRGAATLPREQYATVHRLELSETDLQSGRLSGFAAPALGPKPCAVVLLSGNQTIAVAKAVQFSTAAYDEGVRRGWCGFSIGGIAQGLALGHDMELRCVVSEHVLGHWNASELAKVIVPSARSFLSVANLRGRLHVEGGCINHRQVLPFAVDLAQSRGSRAVLEASYLYLLGRPLDSLGETHFMTDLFDANTIEMMWNSIMKSEEFRARKIVGSPGPFDPGFPFPLDNIDV